MRVTLFLPLISHSYLLDVAFALAAAVVVGVVVVVAVVDVAGVAALAGQSLAMLRWSSTDDWLHNNGALGS